jgi:hypothetical protein
MRRAAPALLIVAACLARQPLPPPEEGDWAVARDRATRSAKLYDGLATDAFASTVYLSPTVRETRARRLAVWTAMTVEERDRLLAAEREEAEKFDDFVVALFTPNRSDNDLDAPKSVWRVALVAAEGEELPVKIEQLKLNATLRALYPFVGDFDVVYRVRFSRFPAPLALRPFTLRLAGAKGRIDLAYAPVP